MMPTFLAVGALALGNGALQNTSRVVWNVSLPGSPPIHASPVVAGDTLLYSTLEPDCKLYCANASNGETLWTYSPPQRDTSDPKNSRCGLRTTVRLGLNESLIHGANDNNTFFALDTSTGTEEWLEMAPNATCPDSSTGKTRPCEVYSLALLVPFDGQTVRLQGSEDGHVRAWTAATGQLLWDKDIGGQSKGMLVAANGSPVLNPSNASQFIIGVDDGFLHCLEIATGQSCGTVETCGSTDTLPSVDSARNLLFTSCESDAQVSNPSKPIKGSVNGGVGAVSTDTFSYRWKHTDSRGIPLYVPEADLVFVGYTNGTVAALSPTNGSTVWINGQVPGKKAFFGACVYDGSRNRIYCANEGNTVVALDAATGQLQWTQSTSGILAELIGPAISSDSQHLFVGDYKGNLASLRLD